MLTVDRSLFVALPTVAVLVGATLFLPRDYGVTRAAQQAKPDLTKAKYYGVATCKDCHSSPHNRPTELALLTEYQTWKIRDKHSLAYAALQGARGKQIGQLLKIDVTNDPACLSCHATSYRPKRKGKKASFFDGVSCDGCHGPAEHWLTLHSSREEHEEWRSKSPADKEALGMFDLRDPIKRGQLCMSCHVGSAAEGKVLTHAMYAAGHPPLPSFELATFSRNLPAHWRDLRDVPYFRKNATAEVRKAYRYDQADFQDTHLALASSVVALRSAMLLLAEQADFASKASDTAAESGWPAIFMAQADCSACHHDLRPESWRQLRPSAGPPGRPRPPTWPLALLDLSILDSAQAKGFADKLGQWHRVFDGQPFGDPKEVGRTAAALHQISGRLRSPVAPLDRGAAEKLLAQLCALSRRPSPDFDSAQQIASAFRAIYLDGWNAEAPKKKAMTRLLQDLDDELNLTVNSSARQPHVAAREALLKAEFSDRIGKEGTPAELSAKVLVRLNEISDEELTASLSRLRRYDPRLFRKKMDELARLLPR